MSSLLREAVFKDAAFPGKPYLFVDLAGSEISMEAFASVLDLPGSAGDGPVEHIVLIFSTPPKGRGALMVKSLEGRAARQGSRIRSLAVPQGIATFAFSDKDLQTLVQGSFLVSYAPDGSGGLGPEGSWIPASNLCRSARISVLSFLDPDHLPARLPQLMLALADEPKLAGVRFDVHVWRRDRLSHLESLHLATGPDDAGCRFGPVLDAAKRDPYGIRMVPMTLAGPLEESCLWAFSRRCVEMLFPNLGTERVVPAGDQFLVVARSGTRH